VLIRMRLAARHPSNRSELPRAGFRVDGLCGRIRPTAGPEPARIKPLGSPYKRKAVFRGHSFQAISRSARAAPGARAREWGIRPAVAVG
jgi:hypothetical protein